ncbi:MULTISPECIES: response regulator transcription factor [unclassified Sphingobium]|uniref:response regulator transcription factor n=1 Tax=unclassified Sphingobium TaxID=2611147 RepID=UPI0010E13D2C
MHIALDLHESLGHQDQRPQGFRTAEPPPLTPTQMKVLRCVHSGLLNKQIAYELGMAEATVKVHMTALMRKLNVRNRTQAAIVARNLGWLRPALGRAND